MHQPPLAHRLRPQSLDQYVGQTHLLGPNKPLRRLLESRQLRGSLLFWGPPGCGKTSLAQLIARQLDLPLESLSAVESGIKELRAVVERCKGLCQPSLLFIDELHRYSKTQQDALLPHVESGLFQLLGATTEPPYGNIIPALLSRCPVHQLKPLTRLEVKELLSRACSSSSGFAELEPQFEDGALDALLLKAQGDARSALGWLEQAVLSAPLDAQGRPKVTCSWIQEQLPEQLARYNEQDHSQCASAWIKSIRGSDTQAALYWLGRMLAGGEPVSFLTRRLRIAASEDVGLADPQAMIHTEACCAAAERIGYPEARYPLAQATLYLSLAPKSDSLAAIFQAEERAKSTAQLPVPAWLCPGGPYKNPHQEVMHFRRTAHLPPELQGEKFYRPGELGYEIKLAQRLEQLWNV